jgi:hypothetical protein
VSFFASSPQPPHALLRGAVHFACWLVAAAATAAGCGGGAAPAKGGAGQDPLAAAEAELAAAEAKLGPRFGSRHTVAPPGPGPADGVPQPGGGTSHLPAQPSPPPTAGLEHHKAEPEDTNADSCETACDALSDMRKAADRICELAPGERCDAARARVADAVKRVTEACSECEG